MNSLKQTIKEKSALQKELKNQRKTVNLVGERTMEPWKATMDHRSNRFDLKYLFIAYAILRGKDPKKAYHNYDSLDSWDTTYINSIIEQYQAEFVDEAVPVD